MVLMLKGFKKDSDVDFLVIINRDMTKEEKEY